MPATRTIRQPLPCKINGQAPPREEMATDVNVIADYGVHKTTRKDTLEPSDTTLAIFSPRPRSREF